MIEPEVEKVLTAVPELSSRYLELVEKADDDPGANVVFEELALFLTDHLRSGARNAVEVGASIVDRVLETVESAARGPDAEELVAWSFLENLGGPELDELRPRMGRRTAQLLDEIDDGGDGGGTG